MKVLNMFLAFLASFMKITGNQHGALSAELVSLGNDLILEVTDGVFSGNKILERLKERKVSKSGGIQIKAPLNVVDDTGTTGEFFSPRDDLSLNEYEAISHSLHDWRYVVETLVLYNADIAKNSSPEGIADLMTERAKISEMALKQRMLKGIMSDGGASTGANDDDQFDGVQLAVAASGVYGNIDPADLASWVSTVTTGIGTLALADLDNLHDEATEPGKGGPTMAFYDKDVFTAHKGLLQAWQRAGVESSLDGFGHRGMSLVYNGIPHIVDNQSPSGEVFYIDEEHFRLYCQKDNDMRVENYDKLETKDAIMKRIFFYGNVVATQRTYHSRGQGITG